MLLCMDDWRFTLMEFLRRVLNSCPLTPEQKLTAEVEGMFVAREMAFGSREEEDEDE